MADSIAIPDYLKPGIERRSMPDTSSFESDYVHSRTPVVLTDLFQSDPISAINSESAVKQYFGSTEISVKEEPVTSFVKFSRNESVEQAKSISVADYLTGTGLPDVRMVCSEQPTPNNIRSKFTDPLYCQVEDGPDDTVSHMFVAKADDFAHMHYDGDFRQVLLYQVYGEKEVILFPESETAKLLPVGQWSAIFLENFSESEKNDFVKFANGYRCKISTGDALYIPAGFWHYVDYCTNSMSINVRFGRNQYTKFLGNNIHPNPCLQVMASNMMRADCIDTYWTDAFAALQSEYSKDQSGPEAKGQHMQKIMEDIVHGRAGVDLDKPRMLSHSHLQNDARKIASNYYYKHTVDFSGWQNFQERG